MRLLRSIIPLLLLATTAATCGMDPSPLMLTPRPTPPDLGTKAYVHVEKLVSFGARDTGSPGWRQAVDYMVQTLRGHGLQPVVDRWYDAQEDLTFENVIVTLPGRVQDRIVIGCHHDTKKTHGHDNPDHNFAFVGANDSGSGVGLLLALAELLASQKELDATYELVFFDGEESRTWHWNEGERALFGSRRYVRSQREAALLGTGRGTIRAFILLDMVGAKDLQIDDELNSDPGLKKIIAASAAACGHQQYFFKKSLHVSDDHLPFLEVGIPAIDLIDLADNPQWHTPDDTLEHISAESMQIVGEVVFTALPEVERQFVPALRRRP